MKQNGLLAKAAEFLRNDAVLCIAVLLASGSMLLVPPSVGYIDYIDWHTLALLFGLMAVMKGFQQAGLFVYLGSKLLERTATSRQMLWVLVFLPFVTSMIITNDVALITFVPFGLAVLRMARQEWLVVPLVVMQTLAANLGSMLTPMGNPQNLYLYNKSGLGFVGFCSLMLPYALASAVCLGAVIVLLRCQPIEGVDLQANLGSPKVLGLSAVGFVLCLLAIFKVLSPLLVAAGILVFLLVTDRATLKSLDYSLLGTFAAFFVFIGNLGQVEVFRQFLGQVLEGHVELVAVLASQVISNVPAALLLSGFTDQWQALIVGCNLGGLGTLIASMASLISYKILSREYRGLKAGYFWVFTAGNVVLLALLLGLAALLG